MGENTTPRLVLKHYFRHSAILFRVKKCRKNTCASRGPCNNPALAIASATESKPNQTKMPSFSGIEITATVDVDFEVFCSCGAHMCGETDTRNSRRRNAPQAVVNACQSCIKNATSPLEDRIAELESELADALSRIP